MKTNICFLSCLSHFFLEWEMFQAKVARKVKTHISFLVTFFENCFVCEKMWKNILEVGRPRMTMGTCALHAGYLSLQIHTHSLCNTYCFSTVTIFTRTHLIVTLYLHCRSCCIQFYIFHLHINRDTCRHIFITELCGQAFSVMNFRKV
jgi:hypothetical protein